MTQNLKVAGNWDKKKPKGSLSTNSWSQVGTGRGKLSPKASEHFFKSFF